MTAVRDLESALAHAVDSLARADGTIIDADFESERANVQAAAEDLHRRVRAIERAMWEAEGASDG